VGRLLSVYEQQGPAALEAYSVPLLSWEDYQAIKEQEGAGAAPALLPPPAEARLLEEGSGGGGCAPAAEAGSAGEQEGRLEGGSSSSSVHMAAPLAAEVPPPAADASIGGAKLTAAMDAGESEGCALDDDAASCSADSGGAGTPSEADSIDLEELYALD
jgi:hypothetical protein